jgi:hypothetical protein
VDEASVENLSAMVSFNTPYATAAHEDVGSPEKYIHGGGPHFLDTALFEEVGHLADRLARELRKTF